jgi:hypothetical protein
MKLLIILVLLALSSIVQAQEVTIVFPDNNDTVIYKEVCLGGKLFATAVSAEGYKWARDVALVQVFQKGNGYTMIPVECENNIN